MGTGDMMGSNMYNKDGSSTSSSTGYASNSGSFAKNSLLPNSFSSNKPPSNMPPIMSSASQKSGSGQPPSDTLSTYGASSSSTSSSASANKMRQSSSQSQRPFPGQYDAVKQEKGSNFKGMHGMKTMSTEMMSTLLSAPKQPMQQPPYSQGVQSNSYRHSQQQQHQQQQQQQKSNLSLDSDLAYKFIDEIKSESSPKLLSKPTSIFSPDWKEPTLPQQQLPLPQTQSRTSSSVKMEPKSMDNKMGRSNSSSSSGSGFNPSGGGSGSLIYDRKPNPKRFNDLSTINMQQFTNIPMTDSSSLLTSRLSSKRPYVPDPSMPQQQQQQQPPSQPAPHHHSKYDIDNGSSDSRENKIRKTDYFSTTTLDTTTASSDSVARNNHDFKVEKTNSSTLKMPSAADLDTDSFNKPFTTQSSQSSSSSLLNNSGRSIETNPDLVSTLLKESLCGSDSNKYGGVFGTGLDEDGGKFATKIDTVVMGQVGGNGGGLLHDSALAALGGGEDGNHRSKAEKKKKKDKHKHKERSKDKEERKKHKKDKERHKERDGIGGGDATHNDMNNQKLPKLTIPTKDLINFHGPSGVGGGGVGDIGMGSMTGFKIKIPKDRIKPDLQSNASSHNRPQQTTQPLKIKICKDMIESYPKYD
jgi:cyclin T